MKNYTVNVREVVVFQIKIEAENQKDAEALADKMAKAGELEFENNGFHAFGKHDWTVSEISS